MRPRSLRLHLSLAFALLSLVVLGGLGAYLYYGLARQLAASDDQALERRLARMDGLLQDAESLADRKSVV